MKNKWHIQGTNYCFSSLNVQSSNIIFVAPVICVRSLMFEIHLWYFFHINLFLVLHLSLLQILCLHHGVKNLTFFSAGFNPVFDESFEFHINFPDLALVRFVVQDDDFIGDGFIGQYTIPMNCIQAGEQVVDASFLQNAFAKWMSTFRSSGILSNQLICHLPVD